MLLSCGFKGFMASTETPFEKDVYHIVVRSRDGGSKCCEVLISAYSASEILKVATSIRSFFGNGNPC